MNQPDNNSYVAPWRSAPVSEPTPMEMAAEVEAARNNWHAKPTSDSLRSVATDGPWIGLGHRIKMDGTSAVESLQRVGMDWRCDKREMSYPIESGINPDGTVHVSTNKVPNKVAVVRTDTDECLGVVGDRVHHVIQNEEHAEFADHLAGSAPVNFIGPWKDGAGLIIQSHLGRELTIGPDKLQPYILSSNAHDGSAALAVNLIAHRFACDNMMAWLQKNTKIRWTIRHTQTMEYRMGEAARVLSKAAVFFDRFEEHGRELVSQTMSAKQFTELVDRMLPIPTGETSKDGTYVPPSARSLTVAERRREEVHAIYRGEMVGEVHGTRWGALQAFSTDYLWSMQSRGRDPLTAQMERVADGRSATYLARVERELVSIG